MKVGLISVIVVLFMSTAGCSRQEVRHNPVDHVNLFIGTLERGNPAGLTIWGYFNNETWVMNGHSSVPLIANIHAMGARNIDLPRIRDVMIWTADNKYRQGDGYIRYGYVPDRSPPNNYCVSQTIEYSIADFGIAQVCLRAGDMKNHERFLVRSRSVFNKFNDDIGYLQRKDRDGNWVWPVDQPHYWPGNQPGFVVPFVYTYAGAHDKTQALIRHVSSTIFKNAPNGLPGDDDLGATSAMNLFFTLGMYPLKPGVPEFCLTGTLFDRVRIRLDNGSEIIAESTGNPLSGPIRSIEVNGKRLEKPFLHIEEILEKAGRLYITYSY